MRQNELHQGLMEEADLSNRQDIYLNQQILESLHYENLCFESWLQHILAL